MLDESKPIFIALAEQIEDGILDGTYAEDTAVPSTNELAAFHRINPATAGKALGLLVESGVLVKRRGIGMFVAEGSRQAIGDRRRSAFTDQFIAPLIREASRLGLTPSDLAAMISKEASR